MKRIWKLDDFYYDLPQELIAQNPAQTRSSSRILQVNLKNSLNPMKNLDFQEIKFSNLASILKRNDLLIFNNSKVIPAKLKCVRETGGKLEMLVIDEISSNTHKNFYASALIKSSKKKLTGEKIKIVGTDEYFEILGKNPKNPEQFIIKFSGSVKNILNQYGEMPLPPYIKRDRHESDKARYQNIFANVPGSIAAPTAGLHFDTQLFNKLNNKGINFNFVTLHVGIGTFLPIRVNSIEEHHMHEEHCEISQECAHALNLALKENRRIIAVGTTSMRVLESYMILQKNFRTTEETQNFIKPQIWKTSLFIKPGFEFRIVDGLITNFHLPESTLMILMSSFLGHEICMKTYHEAIKRRFRFFSYGDAMIAIKPQHFSCNKNLGAN